jgi:hypothetical protein
MGKAISRKRTCKTKRKGPKCPPRRRRLPRIPISNQNVIVLTQILQTIGEKLRVVLADPSEANVESLRNAIKGLHTFMCSIGVTLPIQPVILELELLRISNSDNTLALNLALKELYNQVAAIILRFQLSSVIIAELISVIRSIQSELNLIIGQSLQGPAGPSGPQGIAGPPGPQGIPGPQGPQGDNFLQEYATIDGGFVGDVPNNSPIPFNFPPEINGTFISQVPPSPDVFLKGGQTYLINREIGNITVSSAPVQFILTLNGTEVPYSFTSAVQALGSSTGGTSIVTTPPGEPSILQWVNRSGFTVNNLGATMTIVTIA